MKLSMKDLYLRGMRWLYKGGDLPSQMSTSYATQLINEEYQLLMSTLGTVRQKYEQSYYDYTITSQHQTVSLPSKCLRRHSLIPWDSTNDEPKGDPILVANVADSYRRFNQHPCYQPITGSKLIIHWCEGLTIRLFFDKSASDLSCGIATAVTSTTITLSASPEDDTIDTTQSNIPALKGFGTTSSQDDEYNDELLMIVSALTNGNRQIVQVTDYVGSTRVVTHGGWQTDMPTSNGSNPIVYSFIPKIPSEFHPLLQYAMLIGGPDRTYRDMAAERYGRLYQQFEQWLASEDESSPRRIIENRDSPENTNFWGGLGGSGSHLIR